MRASAGGGLRRALGCWLVAGGSLVAVLPPGVGAEPTAADRQPQEAVLAVLQDEAAGKVEDRTALLEAIRSENPRAAAAQWQAGYVRWKDKWVKYDAVAEHPGLQAALQTYERQRQAAADTPVGQMALADWCRTQGLREQEQVHLNRVLALAPNHEGARTRLGWKWIGGRWFEQRELDSVRQQTEATTKAARTHAAQIKRAFAALSSRNPEDRRKAEQTLEKCTEPAVIPLLLQAFDGANEAAQLQAIQAIDRIRSPLASVTLARIAVANPYNAVGEAAAQTLRSRPFYDYVPTLLSLMSSPVETRWIVEQVAGNQLRYRQVFLREKEDHKEVLMVAHTLRQNAGRVTPEQAQQLANVGQDRVARLGDVNAEIDSLNRSISTVLKTATGEQLDSTPDAWWNWWYNVNESFPDGEKETYTMAYYSATTIPMVSTTSGATGARKECLVAGTPIWTVTGPRPVEQLQTGDLVLSQDPSTGELAYKPVLLPTQRPRGPIIRIETERDTIRCSGGHLFWVSGEGWVRARQLRTGQRLHDVRGSTIVKHWSEEADEQLTYNLIVADFHSYFVGEGKVLSHDNSIPRGTDATVPGLAATPSAQ